MVTKATKLWAPGGYSRVDVFVAVSTAALFLLWLGITHSGERGRILRCADNLNVLGQAVQAYENDHAGGLPAASISLPATKISWDEQLFPYLQPQLAKSNGAAAKGELFLAAAPRFLCPSDTLARGGHPRTYAMAERNTVDWPPRGSDNTGVGVLWDRNAILKLLGNEAWEAAQLNPESLPKLKLSVLPAPARTLLLTEFVVPENMVGALSRTRVLLSDQQSTIDEKIRPFHFKKFNYLMADGHIELWTSLQSYGAWTINGED
jgi:prepilin-type processing-associated H-X9-DG protein